MKARLLLLLAALLCIAFTGCKKEDDKPLTLDDVIGSYEGESIIKNFLIGEEKVKKTITVEKSKDEGKDGKIMRVGFKITENKKGKLSFKFTSLIAAGDGYITKSELHYNRRIVLGTEEFKGKRK